jgi:GrpB-like predicted nucleotidyltransferase (UPF0157 family)
LDGNLVAKPIIDILIVVKDIIKVDEYNEYMILKGYTHEGNKELLVVDIFQRGEIRELITFIFTRSEISTSKII